MAFVNDGNVDFSGGQNDGLLADRILENQYCRGINVTTKNGALSPRPGFVHRKIEVVTDGGVCGMSYAKIFKLGKFQGAASYDTDEGQFIIAIISGVIFRIDPKSSLAEVIELPQGDRLNQYKRRVHWSHAGRFLVLFDYPNQAIIIEGKEARRADPDDYELPISVLGAFVQNRLWIANDGAEFGASDPVGGINPDAPVTFEESLAPASAYLGQFFSLGTQSKNQQITALGFLQVADTSTGVGPVIVATRNSIYAYRGDIPRKDWAYTAFGRLLLYNAGIVGPRAFVNQNSDLIFLSGDNQVRSLLMGRSEQERWSNTPISGEVEAWLNEFKKPELADIGVMGSFGNRVFLAVAPYKTQAINLDGIKVADYAHGGFVVLELDNLTRFGAQAAPAWAGLWTGISPMEVVTLESGCFVFSKDDGGVNRLYEVCEDRTSDECDGREVDIISRIYTREYSFQSRFVDKKPRSIDYSFSNIAGDFTLRAEYKPGHAARWSLWRQFNHKAKTEVWDEQNQEIPILATQNFRELNFGDPDEIVCDLLTGEAGNVMRSLGLRLTIRGRSWRLENIRIRAEVIPETVRPAIVGCDSVEEKSLPIQWEPSDWEIHRTANRDAQWPSSTMII